MALVTPGVNGDLQTVVNGILQPLASASGKDNNRFSAIDIPNNTFTRNPNFWLASLDLSCVAVWNSSSNGPQRGCTLITPWAAVVAHHYPLGVGDQVAFIGNDNVIYKRTVAAWKPRTPEPSNFYDYDYDVIEFDSALPSAVVPALLPGQKFFDTINGIGSGSGFIFSAPVISLITNQFNKVGASNFVSTSINSVQYTNASITQITDNVSIYKKYTFGIIGGDSGHPTLIPISGNRVVLVTTWTFPNSGPSYDSLYNANSPYSNGISSLLNVGLAGNTVTFSTGYNTYAYSNNTPIPPVKSLKEYYQEKLDEKIVKIPGAIGNVAVIADNQGNLKDGGNSPGGLAQPISAQQQAMNILNLGNLTPGFKYNNVVARGNLYSYEFFGDSNITMIMSLAIRADASHFVNGRPSAKILTFGENTLDTSLYSFELDYLGNLNYVFKYDSSSSAVSYTLLNIKDKISISNPGKILLGFRYTNSGTHTIFINGINVLNVNSLTGKQLNGIKIPVLFKGQSVNSTSLPVNSSGICLEVYNIATSMGDDSYTSPFDSEYIANVFLNVYNGFIDNASSYANYFVHNQFGIADSMWVSRHNYSPLNSFDFVFRATDSFSSDTDDINTKSFSSTVRTYICDFISNSIVVPGLDSGTNEIEVSLFIGSDPNDDRTKYMTHDNPFIGTRALPKNIVSNIKIGYVSGLSIANSKSDGFATPTVLLRNDTGSDIVFNGKLLITEIY